MSYDISALAPEYCSLFGSIQPSDPSAIAAGNRSFAASNYAAASLATSVPDFVIFLIHDLECDLSFLEHLHNGDPLGRPTVDDPAGRPPAWHPSDPPTLQDWTASAIDALRYDCLDKITVWDVPHIAYALEKYNGWGYRMRHIPDPYLWGGSQHYVRGKFTADGHFDPDAVSDQLGGMVTLYGLCQAGLVALPAYAA